jgi:NAD(P)-dependent dehydrogenase (short-subunit alcohol dehydrogenase family)
MDRTVVLITGALAGIGRATALAFARDHARLVVSGRRAGAGQALAEELRALGAEAEFVAADVRFEADVQQLVERAIERFGQLDVAVNNAGTEGPARPVTEHDAASLAATFDTNVTGTLLCMKHELRVMLPRRSGSIINLSSIYGRVGGAGYSVYAASKHAIEGLTKSAALEAAPHGIRINAVAPGPIATEMLDRVMGSAATMAAVAASMPARRIGRVEEVAETIRFLASDKAPFIIGESIGIDGGRSAS